MLDRIFSLVRVNRKLILGKNATLVSTSTAGVESTISVTELAALDVTPGTVTASKAVVVDASKNIAGFGSITSNAPTGAGIGYATTPKKRRK